MIKDERLLMRKTIIGSNYMGYYDKTRVACRVIVVRKGKILLSYETKTDQWMIPGGGLEDYESEEDCCVREFAEETGFVVRVSTCLLEIEEYYENCKWIHRYFLGKCIDKTKTCLSDREKKVGMEARWISIKTCKEIFSKYQEYSKSNEMRRGMYLREFTALNELEGCY